MLTTFLITAIILIISVLLMSVKVIFIKGGRFPNTHVSGNKALREKGIACVKTQHRDQILHKNLFERLGEKK